MIKIEIYDNDNVSIESNDKTFVNFIDNCCHIKTKFQKENDILLLGDIKAIKDLFEYYKKSIDTLNEKKWNGRGEHIV